MEYQVVLGATCGRISGVDTFSVQLVRGLRELGIPAHILLSDFEQLDDHLPFPPDVPMDRLPVKPTTIWPERWRAMIRYLEGQAPCVYIPNYDWDHSCVSPSLSERVAILGIAHSDD